MSETVYQTFAEIISEGDRDNGTFGAVPEIPRPSQSLSRRSPAINRELGIVPTVDFVDADFTVIEDRSVSTLRPIRPNGRPLSRVGRIRRAPIRSSVSIASLLPSRLDIAYVAVSTVGSFFPAPCPDLSNEDFYQNLLPPSEELVNNIALANTLEELDNTVGTASALGAAAIGISVVLSGGLTAPLLPAVPYLVGTSLATKTANLAGQHVLRNNAIHRARTYSSGVYSPDGSGDPCVTPADINLVRRDDDCGCIASIPEWWEVRIGANRPQLIIHFAEVLPNGKYAPPKYQTSLPWPNLINPNMPLSASPISPYRKGNIQGVLTLKDNSKFIVNCVSEQECLRVINQAKSFIIPEMIDENNTPKIGNRGGKPVQEKQAKPKILRYFSTGQMDTRPDWEVFL